MSKKVLVVENEQPIRRFLEISLTRAGYEVVKATDGIEGLKQVWQEDPDLIVMEIILPRMDGYEMLNCLETERPERDIPVIILSTLADALDMCNGGYSGLIRYAVKPIAVKKLIDLVKHTEAFSDAARLPAPQMVPAAE